MTFNDKKEELISKFTWVPIPEIEKAFFELQQEYAPTIKMTKNDKDILLYNIENYSFDVFTENISLSDKEKFGLPANKEFQGLSIEDLMRAWLHPEIIKVVKEVKNDIWWSDWKS